ncbi:MAG TPA: cytochrome c [Acidimicrobiales bacterium]|nr:cytochrome c [Acidimicrobiales bacterium]
MTLPAAPSVLAATTQQKLGLATVVILVIGWAIYILINLKDRRAEPLGSEMELAPNRRPYFNDETLEGRRLDRSLVGGLVLMVIVAVGLPVYWANEPSRQEGAIRGFDHRAARRGFVLFQPSDSPVPAGNIGHFGCGGCHGTAAQGGSTTFSVPDPIDPSLPSRQVTWRAPALDTVLLTYSEDEVRSVLVFGRANTPMPPWGVLGGGPMNDQQINDLIAYLASIQRNPDEVRIENFTEFGTDGPKLFDAFCARCHTQGWAYGEPEQPGGGAYGPSLAGGATVRQFPRVELHTEFIAEGAEYAKPYGVRGLGGDEGGGMPGFANVLTEAQIKAIVDYERSL